MKDATLLDTVAALSLNGIMFYAVGSLADNRGTGLMKPAAWLLFTVSPFAVLEPLAYLSETAEYARAFDWAYLGLAVTMALLSHQRQRKSFYYAGLINTGVALWLVTTHYEWFDKPAWAILLIGVGLAGLVAGFGLDWRERRRAVGYDEAMSRRTLLFVLLALAAVPYFLNLGATSIIDSNEAFYTETPREMIESGNYISPTFNYEPRLNKPPLSYWAVAASYHIAGVSLASARAADRPRRDGDRRHRVPPRPAGVHRSRRARSPPCRSPRPRGWCCSRAASSSTSTPPCSSA